MWFVDWVLVCLDGSVPRPDAVCKLTRGDLNGWFGIAYPLHEHRVGQLEALVDWYVEDCLIGSADSPLGRRFWWYVG